MSLFSHCPLAAADPILGLTQAYKKDNDPNKLDLGVGAYRDEEGKPFVLRAVKRAEEVILNKHEKEYLPIDGYQPFVKVSLLH